MAVKLWTLVLLVGTAAAARDSAVDETGALSAPFEKREFKLRSHNPLHIYNQWLRQPRYPTKASSFRDESPDIPRRLIRDNKTQHLGAPPLFVWNHQLLPNFQPSKRHPAFFAALRHAPARRQAKRSGLASILLPRAYDGSEEARLSSGESSYEEAAALANDF